MGSETVSAPDRSVHLKTRAAARAGRRPQKLTDELLDRFIAELREGWYVIDAAERAGVRRRQSLYERRARDPRFRRRWDRAVKYGRGW